MSSSGVMVITKVKFRFAKANQRVVLKCDWSFAEVKVGLRPGEPVPSSTASAFLSFRSSFAYFFLHYLQNIIEWEIIAILMNRV